MSAEHLEGGLLPELDKDFNSPFGKVAQGIRILLRLALAKPYFTFA